MANMHFKADLLPSSDLTYSLGSSSEQWKLNGLIGTPIEYIEGTQTASTGNWTGITKDSTLVEGKVIAYRLPFAGSGNASLTLTYTNPVDSDHTTTGAIAVYAGNTRLTTHYPVNSVLIMVYDGANWRTNPYYNTDNNTLLRTYASATNISVPLIGSSSANSTTAAWATYTNTYKNWYGVIPNDDTKRAKINLSTGHLEVPGGITATLTGTATSATNDSDGNAINTTYIKKSIGTTKGDLIYWSAASTPARLAVGSNTQLLTVSNGVPAWTSNIGNITSEGKITQSGVSVANNDALLMYDATDSKIVKSSIAFDGSTATKALTQKGTWETFNNYSLPTASSSQKGGIKVGSGLSISSDTLSVNWNNAPVTSVAGKTGAVSLGALTIGDSTYTGADDVVVTIGDLGLSSPMTFLGITTSTITDGQNTSPVAIVGAGNKTPIDGNIILEQSTQIEYIYSNNVWNRLGLATSYALANHIHGNISNHGEITSDTAKGSGQHFVMTNTSGKIIRSAVTLGTATNTYLRNDGTWATPPSSTAHLYAGTGAAANANTSNGSTKITIANNTTAGESLTIKGTGGTTVSSAGGVITINSSASADYGSTLPSTGTEGDVFFQLTSNIYELPTGGATGTYLTKNSANDRDVRWSSAPPITELDFLNTSVTTSMWGSDSTYEEYPYKASIPCAGVTSSMYGEVIFNLTEATSGNFAPVAETGTNSVAIWAAEIPDNTIIVPTIVVFKKGA